MVSVWNTPHQNYKEADADSSGTLFQWLKPIRSVTGPDFSKGVRPPLELPSQLV